jgi:hypothetical protein
MIIKGPISGIETRQGVENFFGQVAIQPYIPLIPERPNRAAGVTDPDGSAPSAIAPKTRRMSSSGPKTRFII